MQPGTAGERGGRAEWIAWTVFAVAALLLLEVLPLTVYGVVVPAAAAAAVGGAWLLFPRRRPSLARFRPDLRDLLAILLTYGGVVGCFLLAFQVFTTDRVAGLFLTFAAGLLLGVVGPIVYTVWYRRRPLASLGLHTQQLPRVLALALLFAAIQFALTLYGRDLPADAEDWLPLLVMSLVVGLFEAVYFRGFVQGRLTAMLGAGPAVLLAAALYSLYHVGYGMGAEEMVFLFGLGVTYAVIYHPAQSILVLWPLLTPLGAFFNNLETGDIALPWASIAGFADVLALMAAAVLLARRAERRRAVRESASYRVGAGRAAGGPGPADA